MSELSPAAQAVANAYTSTPIKSGIKSPLAAALRAASGYFFPSDTAQQCYDRLNALADELESH